MGKLAPRACGSLRFWFDGDRWQCWNCVPSPSNGMITIDLKPQVN
jgi:hypothetical protein